MQKTHKNKNTEKTNKQSMLYSSQTNTTHTTQFIQSVWIIACSTQDVCDGFEEKRRNATNLFLYIYIF